MEKNYISEYLDTHFYIKVKEKLYGVCVNIKDLKEKDEIIRKALEESKEQINAWKKEWEVI